MSNSTGTHLHFAANQPSATRAELTEFQRLVGLARITAHADAILREWEPTPIYAAVVAELGAPPVVTT